MKMQVKHRFCVKLLAYFFSRSVFPLAVSNVYGTPREAPSSSSSLLLWSRWKFFSPSPSSHRHLEWKDFSSFPEWWEDLASVTNSGWEEGGEERRKLSLSDNACFDRHRHWGFHFFPFWRKGKIMEGVAAGFFSQLLLRWKQQRQQQLQSIQIAFIVLSFLYGRVGLLFTLRLLPFPLLFSSGIFFGGQLGGRRVRRRRNFRVSADASAYESVKSGVTTLCCCHATNNEEETMKGKLNKSIVVATENLTAFVVSRCLYI